jgi:hypothetical protein
MPFTEIGATPFFAAEAVKNRLFSVLPSNPLD